VGEAVTEDAGRVLKPFWGVREMGAHLERPLHGGVRGRKGTPNGMLERWWRSSTQRLRSIMKSGGGGESSGGDIKVGGGQRWQAVREAPLEANDIGALRPQLPVDDSLSAETLA
jgi:hypothetical protein